MDEAERNRLGNFGHTRVTKQQVSERVPRRRAPTAAWAFVRLRWARLAVGLLLLLGFAVQLVVIAAVWELVDLSVSLMEVWAELARKHLEITLS